MYLAISWLTLDTKAGPLSYPIICGNLHLGRMFSSNFLVTTFIVSVLVGKTSVHPEKVSTNISKYLKPYFPGWISVKSASHYALGLLPRRCEPGCLAVLWVLVNWQALQLNTISSIVRCMFLKVTLDCLTISAIRFTPMWVTLWIFLRIDFAREVGNISFPSAVCHQPSEHQLSGWFLAHSTSSVYAGHSCRFGLGGSGRVAANTEAAVSFKSLWQFCQPSCCLWPLPFLLSGGLDSL